MFYRSPSLIYFGPLPYVDEVYYSTVPEPPMGMRLADDYRGGIVGYVYTSAAPDRVPVYEFYDSTATHHLWSNAPVTGWTKLSPNTFVNSSDDTTVEYTVTKSVDIAIIHNQSPDPEKN